MNTYPDVEVVVLVEPFSLAALATSDPSISTQCSYATVDGYTKGIAYVVQKLYSLSNVYLYIDVGHGGWVGWCGRSGSCSLDTQCGSGYKCMRSVCECDSTFSAGYSQNLVAYVKSTFTLAGGPISSKVRGFVTNIANYQSLGYPNDDDLC